ncbi:hypothetical protein QVD17_16907 [Tagetes erecta]|uniref:Uncharacterized protein n=1 Tax=Tagetes erecta TaxID=13708 RepID=A0AAD8KSV9_TARER|nr:hypothetical protein QVD17_16907 [Tagetes erecta]
MSASKRKRGPASMSKNIPTEKIKLLRFTKDGQPCGSMAQKFKTWYSIKLKRNFSYHIPMSNFPTEDFDILWLQAKAYWMIETDAPKEFMKKWSKKTGTNWRSKLYTKFVKLKKNACDTYSYLEPDHWNDFVAQKSIAEFKAKSARAKAANAANKNVLRVGRSGWVGFKERKENIWPQLVAKYPDLKEITNPRSRWFLMGRAKEIKATNEYELTDFVIEIGADLFRVEKEMMTDESYAQNKDDPLVRVVGTEHGGNSRTVSHLIGKTKVHGGLFKNVNHDTDSDAQPNMMRCGSSYGSDARIEYSPIELAPVMESSHGSRIRTIDSPPMQDEENTFSSGYMPDMNDVNAGSEEMDMHDVDAELQGTFGGNIGDLLQSMLFSSIAICLETAAATSGFVLLLAWAAKACACVGFALCALHCLEK